MNDRPTLTAPAPDSLPARVSPLLDVVFPLDDSGPRHCLGATPRPLASPTARPGLFSRLAGRVSVSRPVNRDPRGEASWL